jgi:hypothetical protein
LTYPLDVAMQEYYSVVVPIEAEQFSPEKSVKDRAYLLQALVIMAWLDKTPTKGRTIHFDCSSNRSQFSTELFMVTL